MDIDPGTSILLLALGATIVGLVRTRRRLRYLYTQWRAFQLWLQMEERRAQEAEVEAAPLRVEIPTALVPGAGQALLHPPADFSVTVAHLRAEVKREREAIEEEKRPRYGRYAFPIGWVLGADGQPDCAWESLVGGINHILITGQSDAGKDNAALNILLGLAHQHGPDELRIAILDGKGGVDWKPWANAAHLWCLARRKEDLRPVLDALTAERERRTEILWNHGVAKWEELPDRAREPLLVVYVAELTLLEGALRQTPESKAEDGTKVKAPTLEEWLNQELVSARALGIRYILAAQTVSNMATRWRTQVGLALAGFQPSQSQDLPNVGMGTAELVGHGAIPPSQLPAPSSGAAGVFTAVQGREALTVRTVYLSSEERRRQVQLLPRKPDDFLQSLLTGTRATEGAVTPELAGSENQFQTGSKLVPDHQEALEPDEYQLRQQIREYLHQKLSGNQIIDRLGGNRAEMQRMIREERAALGPQQSTQALAS